MSGAHGVCLCGSLLPDRSRCFRLLAMVFIMRLMDKILHDLKDSKLWELWYIPYNG